MPLEAHHSEIPANTHRARPKLVPVIIEYGRVLQREPRLVALSRNLDFDPAHSTSKLPRRGKLTRWCASRDCPARIPPQLVFSAQLQLPLNGQEPARNALGVCQ